MLSSHEDIAIYFLNSGAETNYLSSDGSTPLHRACKQRLQNATACLLEKGAYPEVWDCTGLCPLHVAIEYSDEQSVKHIVQKGGYAFVFILKSFIGS